MHDIFLALIVQAVIREANNTPAYKPPPERGGGLENSHHGERSRYRGGGIVFLFFSRKNSIPDGRSLCVWGGGVHRCLRKSRGDKRCRGGEIEIKTALDAGERTDTRCDPLKGCRRGRNVYSQGRGRPRRPTRVARLSGAETWTWGSFKREIPGATKSNAFYREELAGAKDSLSLFCVTYSVV